MQTVNRKWYGERLWYLLNLRPDELRIIFADSTWDNLKNKRKMYNKKIKDGKEPYPTRPATYRLGDSPEIIRKRLNTNQDNAEKVLVGEQAREEYHKLLDEAITNANINPSSVAGFTVGGGFHESFIKNSENEIEYTRQLKNQRISIKVEPRDFEPQWNLVAPPLGEIKPIKKIKRGRDEKSKVCVILPDPQIGFRKFRDGSSDPFHDVRALNVAMQIVAEVQPDKIVWLGDFLDLPMFGKYEQSADYAHTAQMAINYGYKLLAKCRATVPGAEIVVIEGNHDRRIEKSLERNCMSALGLRQAEVDNLKEFPTFSVPHLLRFNELDVEYIEGYPAGRYWINKRLQCIHGRLVRQAGSTAAAVVKEETTSTVFGHIHRIEQAYITQNEYDGGRSRLAHSPGCLCRIDGAVPSTKNSSDLEGRPVLNYENWQQGMSIVNYEDGDGSFNLENIYINTLEGHRAVYASKVYVPVDLEGLDS